MGTLWYPWRKEGGWGEVLGGIVLGVSRFAVGTSSHITASLLWLALLLAETFIYKGKPQRSYKFAEGVSLR